MIEWGSFLIGVLAGMTLAGFCGVVFGFMLCSLRNNNPPSVFSRGAIECVMDHLDKEESVSFHFTAHRYNEDVGDDDDGDEFASPPPKAPSFSRN